MSAFPALAQVIVANLYRDHAEAIRRGERAADQARRDLEHVRDGLANGRSVADRGVVGDDPRR